MPSVCCKPPQGGYYPCFTENWKSVVKPLVEGLWTNLGRIHIFLTPDPHFFTGFPPNRTSASNKQTNKRRLDHWAETWFHLPGKCLRSSSQGEWSLSKKWLNSACLPRPSVVAKAAAEGLLYSFKKDTHMTFGGKKKICLCVYLHAWCMRGPWRPEDEVEYPGTGVQVVVSSYVGAWNQTGPRQEQQVLLSAKASLSPDLTL